jgi:hypothetical protein
MPSPFPGMDPYLESPALWSELHNRMIVAIADDLSPKLRPYYRVAIEQRVYLSSTEEVRETYLEGREISTGRVVTVLELLSPKNKRNGEGRSAYERKQQQVLASVTHFVEIDLLRRGQAFPLGESAVTAPYYVMVARGDRRPNADLYSFALQESMPSFPMPLADASIEPIVPLQDIFNALYDRAGFDLAIDYRQPIPKPALSVEETTWAQDLMKSVK